MLPVLVNCFMPRQGLNSEPQAVSNAHTQTDYRKTVKVKKGVGDSKGSQWFLQMSVALSIDTCASTTAQEEAKRTTSTPQLFCLMHLSPAIL